MKEYSILGRTRGLKEEPLKEIGKIHANSEAEAMQIARKYFLSNTPIKAKLLGELNEQYVPEEHLAKAILGKDYNTPRYK